MTQGTAIIIVGVNRGGTSAVAASLNSLGIFLGDFWQEPNYEDIILAKAFRNGSWKTFENKISEYEDKHRIFGWKLPDVTQKLFKINRIIKNPKYIFIFRDICSISNRMNSALNINHLEGMLYANQQYKNILHFIAKKKPHHILVSYEKMLADSYDYAGNLLDFIELEKNQKNINSITSVISPSPEKYQKWSESCRQSTFLKDTGHQGHLDHLDRTEINGWVKLVKSDQPVFVNIFVNEIKVISIEANKYRHDLIDATVSRTGKNGFSYFFNPPLSSGDNVSVKPLNTTVDLKGSPRILT